MKNLAEIKKINKYFDTKNLLKIMRIKKISAFLLVAQVIIRGEKYNIFLNNEYKIILYKNYNDELYGELNLKEAKKLIKFN